MSDKTNSKRNKIIQSKDIVSLLVVFVMLFCSFTYTYAAVILNKNNLVYTTVLEGGGSSAIPGPAAVNANDLLEFNHVLNSIYAGEKNKTYSVTKSVDLNKLKFKQEILPDQNHSLSKQGWKLANFTTVNTISEISKGNQFPMTVGTFIKEDSSNINLVIAYQASVDGEVMRGLMNGTLFNENWIQNITKIIANNKLNEGNWGTNFAAIVLGYTGAEDDAQKYALNVAKNYANKDKKVTIHITGHSLGGYLAQIGGSKLLQNTTYKNLVKQIGYFNGFGLYVNNKISSILWGINKIAPKLESFIEQMYDYKLDIPEIDSIIQDAYQTLKNNKNKVTLYRIKGDYASPLGWHAGNVKEFYASTGKITGKQTSGNTDGLKAALKVLYVIGLFKMDCSEYPEIYKMPQIDRYMAAVHEIDAFNGWTLVTEKRVVNIKSMYFSNIPYTIKKNQQKTITLTIELNNAELKENINKDDFNVNKNLQITNIMKEQVRYKLDDSKEYTTKYLIRITVKAKKLIVLPSIRLKADAFKIYPNQTYFSKLNVYNNFLGANALGAIQL